MFYFFSPFFYHIAGIRFVFFPFRSPGFFSPGFFRPNFFARFFSPDLVRTDDGNKKTDRFFLNRVQIRSTRSDQIEGSLGSIHFSVVLSLSCIFLPFSIRLFPPVDGRSIPLPATSILLLSLRPCSPPPLKKLVNNRSHHSRERQGCTQPRPLLHGHFATAARAIDGWEGFLLSFLTCWLRGGAQNQLQLEVVGERGWEIAGELP